MIRKEAGSKGAKIGRFPHPLSMPPTIYCNKITSYVDDQKELYFIVKILNPIL